jgi:bifunctional DNA-binding transcriptional regulator/antitoxin component of YhaV-PrlF toxin-antitoxin module
VSLPVAKFDSWLPADYFARMTATISANGLLEIPAIFREADAIQPGQRWEIERIGKGAYQLRVATDETKPKRRLVDVLLDCPVKGWFSEPNGSEA